MARSSVNDKQFQRSPFIADKVNIVVVTPNNIETRDFSTYSLDAKLRYPLNDQVSAFAQVGYRYFDIERRFSGGFDPAIGATSTTSSLSEDGLAWGLGLRYALTDTLSARLGWTNASADSFEMDSFQFSLALQF